ncbi:MAG TPA: vWA domain-containing protein, partial [Pirellulales bacterium]|nr:vWA domain-containing protein [Pirellulales bacterium]
MTEGSRSILVLLGGVKLAVAVPADDPRGRAGAGVVEPLVLLLDKSGSMRQDGRAERLLDAVAALLASLPAGSDVAGVAFDTQPRLVLPRTRLTDENRSKLVDYFRCEPKGGTNVLAGFEEALKLLAGGGRVVIVSDGLQTGAGKDPLPETGWGPAARDLTRKARRLGVVVHAVGLGPDVEADPLLMLLASDTGGRFYAVRQPEDVLAQFVALAGELGSFWRRDEPGEFHVASAEDVIRVSGANDESHVIFRRSPGRLVPVDPVYRYQGAHLRAERYRLEAGTYQFQPQEKSIYCGLLRFDPGDARKSTTAAVDVALGADGQFAFDAPIPARLGPFAANLVARQRGWRYHVGRIEGELLPPPPLVVKIDGPTSTPTELFSRGSESNVVLTGEIACDTQGRTVELIVASTPPGVVAAPGRIRLDARRQPLRLVLTRD